MGLTTWQDRPGCPINIILLTNFDVGSKQHQVFAVKYDKMLVDEDIQMHQGWVSFLMNAGDSDALAQGLLISGHPPLQLASSFLCDEVRGVACGPPQWNCHSYI